MDLNDFRQAALKDPKVLAAARKVVPIDDSSLDWKLELPPGRVEIVMRDGRSFERVGTGIPGSAEAPMDWNDVVRKFSNCASFAPVARSTEEISAVHTAVQRLEGVDDATEVLRALA